MLRASLVSSVALIAVALAAMPVRADDQVGPFLPPDPPESDSEDVALASADTQKPLADDDVVVVDGEDDDDDERVQVVEKEEDGGSFMRTIATSTIFGAITGLMLGGAFYLLDWPNRDAVNFAYWTGIGALAGAGVGLVQAFVGAADDNDLGLREDGTPDPAPTWRVPVLRINWR
jgi:hypothetical protein